MTKITKIIISFLIAAGLLASWFWRTKVENWWWLIRQPELPRPIRTVETPQMVSEEENRNQKIENSLNNQPIETSQPSQPSSPSTPPIPQEINLAVPFTSQAPFARWDHFDEEMCEEASLLMVNRFYQNRGFSSKEDTEEGLKSIKSWEEINLGVWESTDSEQIARIAREMLNWKNSRVSEIFDFQQIKEEVAQNHPVILPAAGRELHNPNFKQPGPLYHMLVVRGWLADGRIITNDPGTRRGEGYVYDQQVLWNAIHDWNAGDIYNGKKVMIVVR